MRYTINKSRFDELVQNFISKSVGGLERHAYPSESYKYIWYSDSNGIMIFEITDIPEGLGLGVFEVLWKNVKGMFSLSDNDTDEAILKWMWNYNGTKYPGGVYTFEQG